MKKKFISMLLALILPISAVGCSANSSGEKTSQPQTSLSIGIMPDLDSIPIVMAENNGYFKEEGLDFKLQSFKSATDRDAAIQSGQIDGAISDMLSAVFFNDNKFEVKMTSRTDGSYKLIAGNDSKISGINDIIGKSVGLSKNTIIEYLTDRIVEASKLDINSIEKVVIPKIPTRLEMLNAGKLDMAMLPEPLATTAVSSGGKILVSSNELNIDAGVIVFTKTSMSSKENEIKAFYRAYNKAVKFLKEEPLENYIDILIEKGGFPDSIKTSLILPHYSEASLPSDEEFNSVMKWMKTKNLTTSNYKLEQLSTDSFIK